jgi:class 3 adenylate cyclase
MDLEDVHVAVREFRGCVSETADRHEGLIARYLGNNALVLFGYPEAQEHDAERENRE